MRATAQKSLTSRIKWLRVFGRTVAVLAVVGVCLTGANRHSYSPHEKAAYADASLVEFVRPGMTIAINSAQIAADGTTSVVYTLKDPQGLPLDAAGITTPGTVSLSYVAAVLPNNQEQYTAYTTRPNSGPAVASTNQPGADSGGVTSTVGPGQYRYVFNTKAPSGFDATATHTIGIYATRVLTDLYASREELKGRRSHISGITHPTLNVGLISGGINTNVVPDRVSFRIDRRIIPEEAPAEVEVH